MERYIFEYQINEIINNPTETIKSKTNKKNYLSYNKNVTDLSNSKLYIIVVHTDLNKYDVIIISVIQRDKGGLKAYGFKI